MLARTAAAVQLALSVVLIAGAFLFSWSLYRLTRHDTGVGRDGLLVLDIDYADGGYKGARALAASMRLRERIRALAGVQSVSFSNDGIYTNRGSNTFATSDAVSGAPGPQFMAWFDRVGPGYFRTLGTRLLAGREFDERDDQAARKVAIVSREFARYYFPDGRAVGRNVYFGRDRQALAVVGIVDDIRTDVRRAPRRIFYFPELQSDGSGATTRFAIRASAPARVAGELRAIVRAEDPALRVASIDSADHLLDRTLDLDRVIAALSFAFGLLAVTLAAVGIYGMLAYDVARRAPEIGVRMALGATRGGVVALVFREVALVCAAGAAIGVAGAFALGRLVEGMVFELSPGDPRVLAAAVALLGIVAVAAALAPARRAASMDPMRALRAE